MLSPPGQRRSNRNRCFVRTHILHGVAQQQFPEQTLQFFRTSASLAGFGRCLFGRQRQERCQSNCRNPLLLNFRFHCVEPVKDFICYLCQKVWAMTDSHLHSQNRSEEEYFYLRSSGDGDYERLQVSGMSCHLPRKNGLIQYERIGPFMPPICFPGLVVGQL